MTHRTHELTGAIDVKMDGSVLEKKSSFKMLGLTFSSKLDWGSYIISIAKTASKKIGALIHSMKFLSPEIALYLYKYTIRPCMEYFCHVWAGVPSCYLELLDKVSHVKSFVHGHLPASWKYFLVYHINFDYYLQTKEKTKTKKTFNWDE